MKNLEKKQVGLKKLAGWLINYRLLYGTGLILVMLGSFFHGKKQCMQIENPAIVIDTKEFECELNEPTAGEKLKANEEGNNQNSKTKMFVASKNGSKYYPIDCKSANRIKQDNKVFYASKQEAEADDKELTSACD
ncbi:MAG: hypothetical protein GF332_00625 [Candidatus Moranbacteria bacterium]|nr:hypothetical protein [Candidatus Moranbacteria bacterium]